MADGLEAQALHGLAAKNRVRDVRAYDRAAYDLRIDYRKEPFDPLPPEDVAWSDAVLRERGLR